MNIKQVAITLACSSLLLTGCNDDNDAPPVDISGDNLTPPMFVDLRVVHASPDAPSVDIVSGGNALIGLEDIDYQTASGFFNLQEGSYTIGVQADLPDGSNAEVLSISADINNDTVYNVFAVGQTSNIEALLVANTKTPVGDGNARAQVVHAAPNAPEVDVYVTAVGSDINVEQALATLSFKGFTGQVEVPAGEYQIRITPAGTKTVVFDSGAVALPEGADLLISATQNVGAGPSPVSLLVADGNASSVLIDANTPAEIRAIHGVADAPAVDVIADVDGDNDPVLFDGAPFTGVTPYIQVAAGDYLIDVAADADNSVVPIDDAAISLMQGVRYTALANNNLANIDLDLIVDTARPIATAAQVRIFHASQATGGVDIYVTADGDISNVAPAFSNVEYSEGPVSETGYVALTPGDYFVTVTPTGTKTAAIETGSLSLVGGNIYTALAVDGDNVGDLPQLILADDFVN